MLTAADLTGQHQLTDQSSKNKNMKEDQEEKMMEFAEMLVWKVERKDMDAEIERFCRGIGVSMQDFKVWMHNHKRSSTSTSSVSHENASSVFGQIKNASSSLAQ